jgi:hypothetical protein
VKGDKYEEWQLDRKPGERCIRDLIKYWIKKQDRYPRLSRMALDFLIIQTVLAKYKRIFSAAGKIIMPKRNRFKVEIIAVEWQRPLHSYVRV